MLVDRILLNGVDYDKVYLGDELLYETGLDYLTFTCIEDGGIALLNIGNNAPNIECNFLDGLGWQTWEYEGHYISMSAGDVVKMKGINRYGFSKSTLEYSTFVMTGKIAASGNIMSLIDGEKDGTKFIPSCCFLKLFQNCSSLIAAPELPATTLSDICYELMFHYCTSLSEAPGLPALTLADWCYLSMFSGCSSLAATPELPATTLANGCYNGMFWNCTSLTSAPALPATTLASDCYAWMFYGCSSLTSAPSLPATTLKDFCYHSMFQDCSALTATPKLLATTLAEGCYRDMFRGCTSLSSVTCLATSGINQNGSTSNWLYRVSSSGTFKKDSTATWPIGIHGIPTNWTVIEE